jgi:hypothetical protein
MTGLAFDHDGPCPDCGAPPGRLCHWWCPRYAEPPYSDGGPADADT